jgi:hypothetical protein
MQMIWKRLNDHGKNWRHVYKALVGNHHKLHLKVILTNRFSFAVGAGVLDQNGHREGGPAV